MENWNDKMKRILSIAKSCPFCGSTDLERIVNKLKEKIIKEHY